MQMEERSAGRRKGGEAGTGGWEEYSRCEGRRARWGRVGVQAGAGEECMQREGRSTHRNMGRGGVQVKEG